MFGVKEELKSAEREEYPMVALLENDSVKAERTEDETTGEKNVKTEIKFSEDQHENGFRCEDCGKGFKAKGYFKRHRLIHTGEKPFKCKECGNRFTDKSQLTAHLRIHTGEKPFTCDICDKAFRPGFGTQGWEFCGRANWYYKILYTKF